VGYNIFNEELLESVYFSLFILGGVVLMFDSRIDTFWATEYFGCTISDFRNSENIVCPHKFLHGSSGAFIMKINDKYILSVPPEYIETFNHISKHDGDLFNEQFLRESLFNFQMTYIGPSWIGYRSSRTVQKEEPCFLNYSNTIDRKLLEEFQKSCDESEWSHGGIGEHSERIAVKYNRNEVVSAADYHLWGKNIAHIGIITHPQYRKKGYAKAVLNDISENLLLHNLIPQYRTLCSNTGAINTAISCDFRLYATHIFLRLYRIL
jgi:GNAT superfamily N-acetyltransferase